MQNREFRPAAGKFQALEKKVFSGFIRRPRRGRRSMMQNEGITQEVYENKGTTLALFGVAHDV
jgi:hypothetical protein